MRAGVILYNPQTKQILLIHRWKNGEEYFVIPGGGAESGETAVQSAQREIRLAQPSHLKAQAVSPRR